MTRFALCTLALALFTDCSHPRCPPGHIPNDMRQACVAPPECDGGTLNDSGVCAATQATTADDGGTAGENDGGGRGPGPAGSGSGGSSGGTAGGDAGDGASGREGMAGNAGSDTGAPPAAPRCGDGKVDPSEACDGNCRSSCPPPVGCVGSELKGAASTCDVECVPTMISTVKDGDGCCPMGANNGTDKDCPRSCGDGDLAPDEKCEPGSPDHPCPTIRDCDDGDPCTMDMVAGTAAQCTAQCAHAPLTRMPIGCDDGNPCTDDELIESSTVCAYECVSSAPRRRTGSCSDTDPCTDDTPTPSATSCTNECPHARREPEAPRCEDSDPCTDDTPVMSTTRCAYECPHSAHPDGTPCGNGMMCSDGECEAPPARCGDGVVTAPEECEQTAAGWSPGTCSAGCSRTTYQPCTTNSECSAGQACPLLVGGACAPSCDSNTPLCPTIPDAEAPVCVRNSCLLPCTSDDDCPSSLSCRFFDRITIAGVIVLEHMACASVQTGSSLP